MAKAIEIIKPKSFAEILEAIEGFQVGSKVSWYRGATNKDYQLQPSLYRHPKKTSINDLINLETEITTRFVQRSLPFLERSLTDDWDKLFLMQHYGVPTRLLDWSENPFVSIYFALVSQNSEKAADAAIWMCDPVAWNQAALDHISYKGGVLDQSNAAMRAYAPASKVDEIPTLPIMIYGSYNSPRIVAQRGGFALFGQGTDSMDKISEGEKFPDGVLKKIVIEQAYIDEIKASLFRKGFTESVVFPDLDGLAKELRRVYSF